MKEKIVVLEQAHDLFTQYGCKRVSMDDVANSLGISKKSIYVHFKNKSELVELSVPKPGAYHQHRRPVADLCESLRRGPGQEQPAVEGTKESSPEEVLDG